MTDETATPVGAARPLAWGAGLKHWAAGSTPLGAAAALAVLFAAFAIASPDSFATTDNLRNIALDSSTLLILAVGLTFVMAAGGIDLSIGSILVLAGVVGVKAMVAVGGTGFGTVLVGLLACVGVGAACGLVNGLVVARASVPPLIVTLGMFAAAYGLALVVSGGQDLTDVPAGMSDNLGYGSVLGIPAPAVVALAIALVAGLALAKTRFGRYSLLIGSNDEAARRAGIPVARHQIKLYLLCGLLAGAAGFINLAHFSSTTLNGHQADNLNAIVAVVIGGTSLFGGRATIVGTVVGVLIPSIFNNGFVIVGLPSYWQQVATGGLLVVVVYADQVRRRRRVT